MKICCTLCVAYHKLNGVFHYFIMKVKEVLNNFSHVYAINLTMTTCVTTCFAYFTMFFDALSSLLIDSNVSLREK
jgi:succinate dehydrogenase/fumarate reductase cytochrome b subunit